MANFLVLYVPTKLEKWDGTLSTSEEIELVQNMTNKYSVMKTRTTKSDVLNIKTTKKEDKLSDMDVSQVVERTQSTLDDMAILVESTGLRKYRLENLIEMIVTDAGVTNSLWQKTSNKMLWQMTATMSNVQSDLIVSTLKDLGLLNFKNVNLNLIAVSYASQEDDTGMKSLFESDRKDINGEFMNSIKARITVAEVMNCVRKNAQFTFDFLVLINIASIIAAMGLVDTDIICLIASMLISPMMGPVVAFIFGIGIRNKHLIMVGLKNELYCFLICLFHGFVTGVLMARINLHEANWSPDTGWPSPDMVVRGLTRTLAMGCLLALVSGAGVCLSVLGGNVSTMIGVAISISLLPPTVNAGLFMGHAFAWFIEGPSFDPNSSVKQPLNCTPLANNIYQFRYSCIPYMEALINGTFSMTLAFLNIISIILSGVLMLRVKEIVPKFPHSTPTDYFFKAQVPLIRKMLGKKEMEREDFTEFADSFSDLYNNLKTDQQKLEFIVKWQDIVMNLENDPVYSEAMKNLPVEFNRMFKAGRFNRYDDEVDFKRISGRISGKKTSSSPLVTPWFVPRNLFRNS